MLSGKLMFAFLAVSWIAVTEAVVLLGTAKLAVVSGLIALKGLAWVSTLGGKAYLPRIGRSAGDDPIVVEQGEKALLSAVKQLDPSGCIQKLLCRLQFKEEAKRTPEENVLVEMFSSGTQGLNSYNAAFVYASAVGKSNEDPSVCEKHFSKCPVNDAELGQLLQQSWGCGIDTAPSA